MSEKTSFSSSSSSSCSDKQMNIIPRMIRSESGRVAKIERFSTYVARQLGFKDAEHECPQLNKLVDEYMKNNSKETTEGSIYEYLNIDQELDSKVLYVKLLEELDRCILSYFAFHWNQAPNIITQVLNVDHEQKKFKNLVITATRKQRFAKVTKDLKITSMFSTLVEEMKAINIGLTDVMVPVAHSQRSPVLLFMGGGMGAGKSTVLKDIKNEPFWHGAAGNAVVVEADAFKETDVIYQVLNARGHHNDMLSTSELVHQSSTDAASSLLVTALNEGRDVIMDGTLSWEPFVQQTIAMVRNVHKCRYRMGIGYKVNKDGTIIENYWESVGEEEKSIILRKPYRIELVGVICDAYLAVVRGIRRAIHTGRAVRVNSQLKSHKRFASLFPKYCDLVDNARLYCTNTMGSPPRLIAWKDGGSRLLVDPQEIKCLNYVANMNDEADSIDELFREPSNPLLDSGSVWKQTVMLPSRHTLQLQLKSAILDIETKLAQLPTKIN